MDSQRIEHELRELVRTARQGPSSMPPGASSTDVGDEIDSLEGVELILAAETRFGISIPDGELGRVCRSIPKIAALIDARLKNRAIASVSETNQ